MAWLVCLFVRALDRIREAQNDVDFFGHGHLIEGMKGNENKQEKVNVILTFMSLRLEVSALKLVQID